MLQITLFGHESFFLLMSIINNLGLHVHRYNTFTKKLGYFRKVKVIFIFLHKFMRYFCFYNCRKSRTSVETFSGMYSGSKKLQELFPGLFYMSKLLQLIERSSLFSTKNKLKRIAFDS